MSVAVRRSPWRRAYSSASTVVGHGALPLGVRRGSGTKSNASHGENNWPHRAASAGSAGGIAPRKKVASASSMRPGPQVSWTNVGLHRRRAPQPGASQPSSLRHFIGEQATVLYLRPLPHEQGSLRPVDIGGLLTNPNAITFRNGLDNAAQSASATGGGLVESASQWP